MTTLRDLLVLAPGSASSTPAPESSATDSDVVRLVATPAGSGFLFGGLTLAIGLRAAMQTVDHGLEPKSLHALFMRPGTWGDPLDVTVARVNDSRAFAVRRSVVSRERRTIAEMVVVAHRPEGGSDHQHEAASSADGVDQLAPVPARLPIPELMEVRPVPPSDWSSGASVHPYWARFDGFAGFSAVERWCAVAFLSDYMVIATPFAKGSTEGSEFLSRTLSQTVWFHRPMSGEWMLASAKPITVVDGRFTSNGSIHDEHGRLVASFVQEGILRPNDLPVP
ncbi:MAG TPA: acyl-CoA thioesterase domain-containing protein [Acidimicrobiales bacterium]|jgi:acyl-CoA thioesterase-2